MLFCAHKTAGADEESEKFDMEPFDGREEASSRLVQPRQLLFGAKGFWGYFP